MNSKHSNVRIWLVDGKKIEYHDYNCYKEDGDNDAETLRRLDEEYRFLIAAKFSQELPLKAVELELEEYQNKAFSISARYGGDAVKSGKATWSREEARWAWVSDMAESDEWDSDGVLSAFKKLKGEFEELKHMHEALSSYARGVEVRINTIKTLLTTT